MFMQLVFGECFINNCITCLVPRSIYPLTYPCLWHPLNVPAFCAAQCLPLVYQQCLQRNSLSFNISPTSATIFIKCRNCHQMKKNIRYKVNINNTSVTNFLKTKVKHSLRWHFAWENLRGGFCCCRSSFDFWYSFHFCIFIHFWSSFCCCSSFVDVLHSHLLFYIIPHAFSNYLRVFTPILYFQPSPSQSDSWHFHFQPFHYLLTANATVLSVHFLPTGVFYVALLPQHFTCAIKASLRRQFFLKACTASYWSSKQRPGPSVCLIHSNPQSSYPEGLVLNFTIYYHELLVVKV